MRRVARWQGITGVIGIMLLLLLSRAASAQSQQGEFTSLPVIEDATGSVVGVILDLTNVFTGAPENTWQHGSFLFDVGVMMQIKGIPTLVRVTPKKITGFSPAAGQSWNATQLNFDGPNCTGTPFMLGTTTARFGGRALYYDGKIYLPKPQRGVYRKLASRVKETENDTGELFCENISDYGAVVTEARTVSLSIFDRFTPPFAIRGLPSLP